MRMSTANKIWVLCVFPSFILGLLAYRALTELTSFIELWIACIAVFGIGLIIDIVLHYIVENGLVVVFDMANINDEDAKIMTDKIKNVFGE